jgi:putative mRNA 3-end processing factor
MFEYDSGIRIRGIDLWLDSRRRRERGFISHAHSDHFARHRRIYASRATARLIRDRTSDRSEIVEIPMNEPVSIGDARVTLFPSGHMLGASQVLVERDGRRLVYTGDFCLEGGFTSPPAEIRSCDVLIMETTYGLPQYRFPPKRETIERIAEFVRSCLERGETPVLQAYALGKSQELVKALGDRGFRLSLHEKAYRATEAYRELGVELRSFHRFPDEHREGDVVILPPHLARTREARRRLVRPRYAFVSGWAVDGRPIGLSSRLSFPLSDHADFPALLEYVRQARPEVVYTTHGFDEFRAHLSEAGFEVRPLASPAPATLFDGLDSRAPSKRSG